MSNDLLLLTSDSLNCFRLDIGKLEIDWTLGITYPPETIGQQTKQWESCDLKPGHIALLSLCLSHIPPFACNPVQVRNIEHTRWQETNRFGAMVTDLRKLGFKVGEHRDVVSISP